VEKFLVKLFGPLTEKNNPSLITIEYPECETKTISILWSKRIPSMSFADHIDIFYFLNINIPEYKLGPFASNFNVDSSKLSYKYDVIPSGITFSSSGIISGAVTEIPNNENRFTTNVTISYPNLADMTTKIIWQYKDQYDDDITIDEDINIDEERNFDEDINIDTIS
jgi:hypothetical protein